MIKKFGLIGYPLGHSFSASYFRKKWEAEKISGYTYDLFPIPDLSNVRLWLAENPAMAGFNVTIPFKQAILPLLDEVSDEAVSVGAVNTVKVVRNKNTITLKGYNTDIAGVNVTLGNLPKPDLAMVLGTGGASAAIQHALASRNIPFTVVSRNAKSAAITYQLVTPLLLSLHSLVINCTPLGTAGFQGELPLPWKAIGSHHLLFDLTYNPPVTPFLRQGLQRGAAVINGFSMLAAQADEAWKIWMEA